MIIFSIIGKPFKFVFRSVKARCPKRVTDFCDRTAKQCILLKELIIDALPFVTVVAGIVSVKYWNTDDKTKFDAFGTAVEAAGGQFFLSTLTMAPMAKINRNLSKNFVPSQLMHASHRRKKELLVKFEQCSSNMPTNIKEKALSYFKTLDEALELGSNSLEDHSIRKLELILSLPYNKPPRISEETFHRFLKPKINKLINNYSKEFQEQIKAFIRDIIRSINREDSLTLEDKPRVQPILLIGPSGVGKTTLIKKIAKIIGIACERHRVAQITEDRLNGSYEGDPEVRKDIILETLSSVEKSHHHNTVIFFLDEVDKALPPGDKHLQSNATLIKPWLLDHLNDEMNYSPSRTLRTDIPISSLITVLAVNRDFIADFESEEEQKAFYDRIKILKVDALTKEAKEKIGLKYYRMKLKALQKEYDKNNTPAEFRAKYDESNLKRVKEFIQSDPYPGVRILQHVIDDYINHVKDRSFFKDFCPDDFDVAAAYRVYQNKELTAKKKKEGEEKESKETKETKDSKDTKETKDTVDTGVGLGLCFMRDSQKEQSKKEENASSKKAVRKRANSLPNA